MKMHFVCIKLDILYSQVCEHLAIICTRQPVQTVATKLDVPNSLDCPFML